MRAIKSMLLSIVLGASPLLSLLSSSATAAPGWGQSLTIASLIPIETGLTLQVVDNSSNPMGCTAPAWLHISTSDANFALISSSILTAFAQGKTIKVWQLECYADGTVHFSAAWIDR